MRLLFAHDHFFETDSSGRYFSEKFPYPLWKPYLKHFSSITVVARNRQVRHSSKSIADGEGISIEPLPSLSSIYGQLFKRKEAHRILSDKIAKVDAIIIRLPSEIGLYVFNLAKKYDKPVLIEMVGCAWDSLWYYGTIKGKFYAPIAYYRNRSVLSQATYVTYVTQNFLQRRYPTYGRSIAISNVRIPVTSTTVLEQRLLKSFPQKNEIRIGLIGNLLPYKGIRTFLEVGAILKSRIPPFRLLFLGGGDPSLWQMMAVRLGVSDICEFIGTLPAGKPILEWLDILDIYVQPSLTEGTPRAMLEAMSRGCPIIASDVGGIPEFFSRDRLCSPGNAKKMATLVERIVTDSQWRIESSKKNFQKAQEYTQDILDKRRNNFLNEFVAFSKSK